MPRFPWEPMKTEALEPKRSTHYVFDSSLNCQTSWALSLLKPLEDPWNPIYNTYSHTDQRSNSFICKNPSVAALKFKSPQIRILSVAPVAKTLRSRCSQRQKPLLAKTLRSKYSVEMDPQVASEANIDRRKPLSSDGLRSQRHWMGQSFSSQYYW